jgi:glycine dehydrogenase subunit 1
MAIAASVYLAWLGPEGIGDLGRQCAAKARYAASRIETLSNARLAWPEAEVFKEFAVRPSADPVAVQAGLLAAGFLVGPVVEDTLLVAVTERRTRDEIDALAKAFEEVAG